MFWDKNAVSQTELQSVRQEITNQIYKIKYQWNMQYKLKGIVQAMTIW
jgi:hypothetical protein